MLRFAHTTAEGQTMLVSQMETDHLLNYIRLKIRKAGEIERRVSLQNQNPFKSALYGRDLSDPEEAAKAVEHILLGLAPYTFEAFFRMFEIMDSDRNKQVFLEIVQILEVVLQRKGMLDTTDIPLLSSGLEEIQELGDDEFDFPF